MRQHLNLVLDVCCWQERLIGNIVIESISSIAACTLNLEGIGERVSFQIFLYPQASFAGENQLIERYFSID